MKRLDTYHHIRGFNYQPSYAGHGLEIWGDKFDPAVIERELSLGKKYFPGMNTVRLWLSHDAFIASSDRFGRHFGQVLEIVGRLNLKAIVVLFNAWHSFPDFGGISTEQIGHFGNEGFTLFTDYLDRIVKPYARDERVLLWDLCNEPFNNAWAPEAKDIIHRWLERVYATCKSYDPDAPLCIGAAPLIDEIRRTQPVSDVITFHPYWARNWFIEDKKQVTDLLDLAVDLGRQTGKPVLVTETGWGSLDDRTRCETLAFELGELVKRDLGFIVHLLHHTLVADGHRPEYGPITPAGYMAFIERDGSLRPGHDIFNRY